MFGYGAGALAGITFGGRRGDTQPFATAIPATALIAVTLAALTLWGSNGVVAVALIVALGALGLVANPILVAQVVRAAGPVNTLAMSLSTSSFNVGIAGRSWLGGLARSSGLGVHGPPLVGLVIAVVALPCSPPPRSRRWWPARRAVGVSGPVVVDDRPALLSEAQLSLMVHPGSPSILGAADVTAMIAVGLHQRDAGALICLRLPLVGAWPWVWRSSWPVMLRAAVGADCRHRRSGVLRDPGRPGTVSSGRCDPGANPVTCAVAPITVRGGHAATPEMCPSQPHRTQPVGGRPTNRDRRRVVVARSTPLPTGAS